MNSLFIICKFLVHKNDLNPEIEKLWLPLWYTATWNRKSVGASTRWNSIIICKILVYKDWPCPWNRKVWLPLWDKIIYSSFAKFRYARMILSLKLENVLASMRWNSIFIICKISVYNNDPDPEIEKVWLPLWDEILHSSSAKFRYTTMTLTLKSKKCGCLYEMKFYIHHLLNFSI